MYKSIGLAFFTLAVACGPVDESDTDVLVLDTPATATPTEVENQMPTTTGRAQDIVGNAGEPLEDRIDDVDAAADEPSPDRTAGYRFAAYADDGQSVRSVTPERYLGVWFEIASTPSFQQAQCTGTTAEYSLTQDGAIGVINRCFLGGPNGRANVIEGQANPEDDTFARLRVDFGFGFDAPYIVMELDGDDGDQPYQFALVSSFGSALWLLAREPSIDDELYQAITERGSRQGLPVGRLVRTEHGTADQINQSGQ